MSQEYISMRVCRVRKMRMLGMAAMTEFGRPDQLLTEAARQTRFSVLSKEGRPR